MTVATQHFSGPDITSRLIRTGWVDRNKTRTILIVLSTAVGVFAIGVKAGAQVALSRDLTGAYLAVEPAAASLTVQPFDEELVRLMHGANGSGSTWIVTERHDAAPSWCRRRSR